MSPARTRVKICGVKTHDAIDAAIEGGADALGFVFVDASPRFIKPEKAWPLVASLPPLISSVGLFQNHEIEAFIAIEETCPTAMSQLHGEEAVNLVRDCGPGVIKSVRFDAETIAEKLKLWDGVEEVDAILIDGSAGGLGESFAWEQLAEHVREIQTPIIVAGGLTPENVGEAIGAIRPYGVDVSSGVESRRGVKDSARIRAFCQAVLAADASRIG